MGIGPKTWLVAYTNTVTRDDAGAVVLGGHLSWVTMVDMDNRDGIPVFTTEDRANNYIRAGNEEHKLTAVLIKNMAILADTLQELLNAGIADTLVLDPAGRMGKVTTMPLPEFLFKLRGSMGQR